MADCALKKIQLKCMKLNVLNSVLFVVSNTAFSIAEKRAMLPNALCPSALKAAFSTIYFRLHLIATFHSKYLELIRCIA